MNKPQISVIMAVYNAEKYLVKSINSILGQTVPDFELIIVNDNSTDKSLLIIKEFQKIDPRIIYLQNNSNLGPAISRNKALKIAKGKYIAIQDADDLSRPQRLELQYLYLEQNKNIDLLFTGGDFIDQKDQIVKTIQVIKNSDEIDEILPLKNIIVHSSVMYRKQKNLQYRTKFSYAQDYDFFLLNLSNKQKFYQLPDKLIQYRINPQAISFAKHAKQRLFALQAQKFYQQRIKYGKDKYVGFQPQKILNLNIEKSKNKNVILAEIWSSWDKEDYLNCRNYLQKYKQLFGLNIKLKLCYLVSYMPVNIISILRRIKQKIIQ